MHSTAGFYFIIVMLNALKIRRQLCGTTAADLPAPMVLLRTWSPSPWYYREVGPHPRSVTMNSVPITAE